jgi:tetratricopeptide (TPR) repeat protein
MRLLIIGFLSCALFACSVQKPFISNDEIAWNDVFFSYTSSIKVIQKEELFRLDHGLYEQLHSPKVQQLGVQGRTDYFLELLYGSKNAPYAYEAYKSSTASKTWENGRGDCISLTILAYAIGKELKLPIVMQEVAVPVQFDRRGNIEYVNGHVNAVILDESLQLHSLSNQRGYVLIDFDATSTNNNRGKSLDENGILARFYNNIGAEYLSKKELNLAYAYFKRAIIADPSYSPSFSNLAGLYLSNGLSDAAETILKQAIVLNRDNAIAVNALHKYLLAKGRVVDAKFYDDLLQKQNQKNPYYWFGKGVKAMGEKMYTDAVHHFEKAQELSQGFSEVHQYLAEAFMQIGDLERAKTQLAILTNLVPNNAKMIYLRNKLALKSTLATR